MEGLENMKLLRARDDVRAQQRKQVIADGNIVGMTLEFRWWYRIARPWLGFFDQGLVGRVVDWGTVVVIYTATDNGVLAHTY